MSFHKKFSPLILLLTLQRKSWFHLLVWEAEALDDLIEVRVSKLPCLSMFLYSQNCTHWSLAELIDWMINFTGSAGRFIYLWSIWKKSLGRWLFTPSFPIEATKWIRGGFGNPRTRYLESVICQLYWYNLQIMFVLPIVLFRNDVNCTKRTKQHKKLSLTLNMFQDLSTCNSFNAHNSPNCAFFS